MIPLVEANWSLALDALAIIGSLVIAGIALTLYFKRF